MPKAARKSANSKKALSLKKSAIGLTLIPGLKQSTKSGAKKAKVLQNDYLSRRPHRTFRRTFRRDYRRSLELPGYVAFTNQVWQMMRLHKRLFVKLVVFYTIATTFIIGLSSQNTYSDLSDLLDQTGADIFHGGWGALGQAGLLLFSGLSGSFNPQLTEAQQLYSVILFLLTWLTTVWLIRTVMSGKNPRLRDGLYRAGAPIVATAALLIVLMLQFLPAGIGMVAFNAAISSGLFNSGLLAMIITVGVGLLIILSLYWMTSTVIGLVIVTLPGMYPWQALKAAGDIVIGRRARILKRILWLMLCNIIIWVVIVLPIIVLERWLKNALPVIEQIPVVPIVIGLATAFVVVWSATYVYLLYRKVVDDDASPA